MVGWSIVFMVNGHRLDPSDTNTNIAIRHTYRIVDRRALVAPLDVQTDPSSQ